MSWCTNRTYHKTLFNQTNFGEIFPRLVRKIICHGLNGRMRGLRTSIVF